MSEVIIKQHDMLNDLHNGFLRLTREFRDQVCDNCKWSEATFYRKAKGTYEFSKAENDRILEIAEKLLMQCWELIQKHRER